MSKSFYRCSLVLSSDKTSAQRGLWAGAAVIFFVQGNVRIVTARSATLSHASVLGKDRPRRKVSQPCLLCNEHLDQTIIASPKSLVSWGVLRILALCFRTTKSWKQWVKIISRLSMFRTRARKKSLAAPTALRRVLAP